MQSISPRTFASATGFLGFRGSRGKVPEGMAGAVLELERNNQFALDESLMVGPVLEGMGSSFPCLCIGIFFFYLNEVIQKLL